VGLVGASGLLLLAASNAAADGACFERLGSGSYRAKRVSIGRDYGADRSTIIHLHQMGKPVADNTFSRVVDAIRATRRISADVISVPWVNAIPELERAIGGARDQSIVLLGHGEGGGVNAQCLALRYPDKIRRAVLVNPWIFPNEAFMVPTLLIRGEHDCSGERFIRNPVPGSAAYQQLSHYQTDLKVLGQQTFEPTQCGRLYYYPVPGADTGLRFRPAGKQGPTDGRTKYRLASSAETRTLNQRVGEAIVAFLQGESLPPFLDPDQLARLSDANKGPAAKKKPAAKKRTPGQAKDLAQLASSTSKLGKGGRGLTVVHLPGEYEARGSDYYFAPDELFAGKGISGQLLGINWVDRWDELRAAVAAAKDHSVVLSGHLEGGEMAYRLAEELPQKVRAMVLHNPSIPADRPARVPTLVVRGEHDQGPLPDQPRLLMRELRTMRSPREKVTWIPVARADRVLHYLPEEVGWRESDSRKTEQMRGAIAEVVAAFFKGKPLPQWVGAAHAELGVASEDAATHERRATERLTAAGLSGLDVGGLPTKLRGRAKATLAANQQMLELMAKEKGYGMASLDKIIAEQRDSTELALDKVVTQHADRACAHPRPPEIAWLRPTKKSKRTVQVVRYSQPDPQDLHLKVSQPAAKKGIKPSEIAVINLRLENNSEARWPGIFDRFRGMKMIDAGYLDHSVPPLELVQQVLETMRDPKLKLVVLHCYAGKARTGTMAAAMRIALDGWSAARALKEAEDNGLTRPIQRQFITWFAQQVKSGEF
jgi:pimeloyl-ACP methyl ester carboxylesterase/protein-tyrosine phosphatase